MHIGEGALVAYQGQPARVSHVGEKLELQTPRGAVRVRPKDVVFLHPGPLVGLSELEASLPGEFNLAWELAAGQTLSFTELAELALGESSPRALWQTYRQSQEDFRFEIKAGEVRLKTTEEVAALEAKLKQEQAKEERFQAALARVHAGSFVPEDQPYLTELEAVALAKQPRTRFAQALGVQTPEAAHRLLLKIGAWHFENPHPSRQALLKAPEFSAVLTPSVSIERTDLTYLTSYAIDDAGTEDPDDALALEILPAGFRLWVHVADPVPWDTPEAGLEAAARARGSSIYLPEGTIPMLPPELVAQIGLGLKEVSPALSFRLDFNHKSELIASEVIPSWVKVTRLSYEQASLTPPVGLAQLPELAGLLRKQRQENGASELFLPEVRITVREGQVSLTSLPPLPARDWVKEAMLAAGNAAALWAWEREIAFPYSSQEPPSREISADGLAGMYAQRRSTRRASVSTRPAPHAGLGLGMYSQVTSPLRRYPDFLAHLQIHAALKNQRTLSNAELVEKLAEADQGLEKARAAELASRKHWSLVYLMQEKIELVGGVLVERQNHRGTFLLPELGLEAETTLNQDLPLNTDLELKVLEVDLPSLTLRLNPNR